MDMWLQVVAIIGAMVASTASIVIFIWKLSDSIRTYVDAKFGELDKRIDKIDVNNKDFVTHDRCKCSRIDFKKDMLDKVDDMIAISEAKQAIGG